MGVAATAVLSSLIFDESLTALMGVGIALIIAGVLTVELGSQKAHATEVGNTGVIPGSNNTETGVV
jgi:small multidrug resistance pump